MVGDRVNGRLVVVADGLSPMPEWPETVGILSGLYAEHLLDGYRWMHFRPVSAPLVAPEPPRPRRPRKPAPRRPQCTETTRDGNRCRLPAASVNGGRCARHRRAAERRWKSDPKQVADRRETRRRADAERRRLIRFVRTVLAETDSPPTFREIRSQGLAVLRAFRDAWVDDFTARRPMTAMAAAFTRAAKGQR